MQKNTLHTFKIIAFLIIILSTVGCHNSRNRLSNNDKKWKLIISDFNNSVDKEDAIIDFDKDGYFTLTSESKVSRGKFQTKGSDSILLKMKNKEGVFKATYHFIENKLKIEGLVDQKDTLYWELEEY